MHNCNVFFVSFTGTCQAGLGTLYKEHEQFQDILVFDFIDTYLNLTTKTLTSFNWIYKACRHVQFYLKIDDDMFVYPSLVFTLLVKQKQKFQNGYIGDCTSNAGVIRSPRSKYFVSREMFKSNKYPPFCFGTAYVVSNYSVKAILKVYKSIPITHLEDTAIGIIVQHDQTITIHNIPRWRGMGVGASCPRTYTSHGLTHHQIVNTWLKCGKKISSL